MGAIVRPAQFSAWAVQPGGYSPGSCVTFDTNNKSGFSNLLLGTTPGGGGVTYALNETSTAWQLIVGLILRYLVIQRVDTGLSAGIGRSR
jgi:hypothetical protein